jgi:hypothetical protein
MVPVSLLKEKKPTAALHHPSKKNKKNNRAKNKVNGNFPIIINKKKLKMLMDRTHSPVVKDNFCAEKE